MEMPPIDERNRDALDRRQEQDRLKVRRVEALLDVLPWLLVLTLAKDEDREVQRKAPGDLAVDERDVLQLERLDARGGSGSDGRGVHNGARTF